MLNDVNNTNEGNNTNEENVIFKYWLPLAEYGGYIFGIGKIKNEKCKRIFLCVNDIDEPKYLRILIEITSDPESIKIAISQLTSYLYKEKNRKELAMSFCKQHALYYIQKQYEDS